MSTNGISSAIPAPTSNRTSPLIPDARPLPGVKDGFDDRGNKEYWQPNLSRQQAAAVQGLIAQATAHPVADVNELQGLPAGTFIMEANQHQDGFVNYHVQETSSPVQLLPPSPHVNPEVWYLGAHDNNIITPDGNNFSAANPTYNVPNPRLSADNPTDNTRLYLVDPEVGKALLGYSGKTDHNWGFVDPQDTPPPTIGSRLHDVGQDFATIGHTIHDAVTFPYDVDQMGKDILLNG